MSRRAAGTRGPVAPRAAAAALPVRTVRHLLGPPRLSTFYSDGGWVDDGDRVLLRAVEYASAASAGAAPCAAGVDVRCDGAVTGGREGAMAELARHRSSRAVRAGPRAECWFDPAKVRAAVATVGGLCPGTDDVVAAVAATLHRYGVPEDGVLGVRNGLRGFRSTSCGAEPPVVLTPAAAASLRHTGGGSALGTARGGADAGAVADYAQRAGLSHVYIVGGDGGNRAAHAAAVELLRRAAPCAVVSLPKSVDNDILLVDRTFGFDTAVEEACRALRAAAVEARSTQAGVGVVKLMGRRSGFIAMHAALSSGACDVVLLPEVPVVLHGESGFLRRLECVLRSKGSAVVAVAEGACQDLMGAGPDYEYDRYGNPVLRDVGPWLVSVIDAHFASSSSACPLRPNLKYIDPGYLLRAAPTLASDKMYCNVLGANAVHAAMAGYTGVTVGAVNTHHAVLPTDYVTAAPRVVDVRGRTYNRMVAALGQPHHWGDATEACTPVSS